MRAKRWCGMALVLCVAGSAVAQTAPTQTAPTLAKKPGVAKVENGGLLFTDNQAGISGTDGGFSAPIGDKTLWLFGDVFLLHPTRPAKPYVGAVSNCALLVPKGTGAAPLRDYHVLTDPKTGLARQVVRNRYNEGNDVRIWPAASWHDAKNHKLYTYYGVVRMFGPGTYDFKGEGHGLAVADTRKPESLGYQRLTSGGSHWWWTPDGPVFGTGLIADGPGLGDYLYIVGQRSGGNRAGVMARVRKARITDANSYEYFAGNPKNPRWSKDRADCADVEGLKDFPSEASVSYNRYLGGYLAVHNIVLDDRIRVSLAPKPWGPYREIAIIGAPRQAFQKNPCYAGKEHPELAEEDGRVVYITYVDQQRYWLQLLKVTLTR